MHEEANNSDSNSVTPDVIQLKGGVRRNSTRETISTGSPSFCNSDGKVLSRYLRPSTGSCHDVCKYGRKDASESPSDKIILDKEQDQLKSSNPGETRKKHPFLLRSLSSKIILNKEQAQYESSNPGERKKNHPTLYRSLSSKIIRDKEQNQLERKELNKSRVSLQLKLDLDFSDKSKVTKKTHSPAKKSGFLEEQVNIKLGTPSPLHESAVSSKQAVLPASLKTEVNQAESLDHGGTKKVEVIKQKTALHSKNFPDKPKMIRQQEISPSCETDNVKEPHIIMEDIASQVKELAVSVESKMVKQKALSSVKKSNQSVQSQVLKQSASSPLKRVKMSGKTVVSLKRKTAEIKPISARNHLRSLKGQINQEAKMGIISKIGEENLLKPPSTSLSPKTPLDIVLSDQPRKHRNTKYASIMKNQGKSRKTVDASGDVKEKVQCATDQKLGKTNLDFIQTEEKTIESIFETQATGCKIETSKGEDRKRHRRSATVHIVENLSKHHKLRFERGKVVDLRPENNGPRRLRFKKGRVVGENQTGNGEAVKRSGKRAESSCLVSDVSGLEAQAVLLKHHEMQGKKDPQGLFNHVIEETATMLEERRKSKVKALVGAFETVISLQESKQASTVDLAI